MTEPVEDILADCLESLERGEMDIAECLARYPAHRDELNALLMAATMIQAAPEITPRPAFRLAARRRIMNKLASPPSVTVSDRLRYIWQTINIQLSRRPAMSWILVVTTIVAFLTGGTVRAADSALPGDLLYGLDRAVETFRLNFARSPEEAVNLRLDLASERLEEAEALSELGDMNYLDEAMGQYREQISDLANETLASNWVDSEASLVLLDEAFSFHELQLRAIFRNMGDIEIGDGSTFCDSDTLHPASVRLAAQYAVTAEEIMTWFCEGDYGFGEIMLALETSAEIDFALSPEELLAMKAEAGGWGTVWQSLGFFGRPGHPGRPDGAGQDGEGPGGRPDDVPVGPPDDAPGGPPDDAPGGPPDDAPGGPPDDAPGGPPVDAPNGPPEGAPNGPAEGAPNGPTGEPHQGTPNNSSGSNQGGHP